VNDDRDEDTDLFRRAVADVKPLQSEKEAADPPKPPPVARFTRADRRAVLEESINDERNGDLETGEELNYAQPGVRTETIRKLRRGQLSIEAEIDLHGLTADEAREALKAFIQECMDGNLRCIRVIHGKGLRSGAGGPVLKPKLNLWLRRWNQVLAFATARPVDGGTGAVYVLLKTS